MHQTCNSLAVNARRWHRNRLLQDSTWQPATWQKATPIRRVTIAQMQPVRVEGIGYVEFPDIKQRNHVKQLRSNQGVLILDIKLQQKYYSHPFVNKDSLPSSYTLEIERRRSFFSCNDATADRKKSFCDSCSSFGCSCTTSTTSGLPPISRQNTPNLGKKDLVKKWLCNLCS